MIWLWILLATPTACMMDFNEDGFVTATDFLIFRKFINQPANCSTTPDPPGDMVVVVSGDTITLTWTAPTLNKNGTPLLDLAGYTVYGGVTFPGPFTELQTTPVDIEEAVFTGLTTGLWCFDVTASDDSFNESEHSNIACKDMQ